MVVLLIFLCIYCSYISKSIIFIKLQKDQFLKITLRIRFSCSWQRGNGLQLGRRRRGRFPRTQRTIERRNKVVRLGLRVHVPPAGYRQRLHSSPTLPTLRRQQHQVGCLIMLPTSTFDWPFQLIFWSRLF